MGLMSRSCTDEHPASGVPHGSEDPEDTNLLSFRPFGKMLCLGRRTRPRPINYTPEQKGKMSQGRKVPVCP